MSAATFHKSNNIKCTYWSRALTNTSFCVLIRCMIGITHVLMHCFSCRLNYFRKHHNADLKKEINILSISWMMVVHSFFTHLSRTFFMSVLALNFYNAILLSRFLGPFSKCDQYRDPHLLTTDRNAAHNEPLLTVLHKKKVAFAKSLSALLII